MLLGILLILDGCGSLVKIPDVAVYKQLPFSGKCLEVYTIRDDFRLLNSKECENIVFKSLLITPEAWAEIKKTWLTSCNNVGSRCAENPKAIDEFLVELDNIFKGISKLP